MCAGVSFTYVAHWAWCSMWRCCVHACAMCMCMYVRAIVLNWVGGIMEHMFNRGVLWVKRSFGAVSHSLSHSILFVAVPFAHTGTGHWQYIGLDVCILSAVEMDWKLDIQSELDEAGVRNDLRCVVCIKSETHKQLRRTQRLNCRYEDQIGPQTQSLVIV